MKFSFSTEAVDLDHQAPNRNRRESRYYWDELYTLISAGGFKAIEIPYEAKWDFGGRSGIPRSLHSINTKFGSVPNYIKHLSDSGIDGISCVHLDPSLFCSGPVDMYFGAFTHFGMEAIEFASEAGAAAITITATPPCFAVDALLKANPASSQDDFLQRTARTIEILAKSAQKTGLKLCLKNEYWGLLRGENILSFIQKLSQSVYLDVDTAHLQIAGVNVSEFIPKNKDRIGVVHYTDTDFTDIQNAYLQALPEFPAKAATKVFLDMGQGCVDFKAITEALGTVGYDEDIVCNCRNSYDVCQSILRMRYFIDHMMTAVSNPHQADVNK